AKAVHPQCFCWRVLFSTVLLPGGGHFIIFLIVTGEKAEEKASSSPLNNSMIPVHAKSDFQLTHTERCTKNRQPRQLRVCSRGLLRIFCKLSEEIFTTPE
ncbi:hypothetical protein ACV9YC_004552, partial [Escherichia coli]